MTEKAVVLAAGRGTRMMAGSLPPGLTEPQQGAARRGLKAMIPLGRPPRPFLDYVLSGLADAGFRRICLVLSPAQQEARDLVAGLQTARLTVETVEQREPLGTAHAVQQAEPFAAGDSFVVINGDNLYPTPGLAALRRLPRSGLLGFPRSTLVRESNIPPERIHAFALIESRHGVLTRIVEKPGPAEAASFGPDPLISMNAWLLPPTIFPASRSIAGSARGELELPSAVIQAIDRQGERFLVVECSEGVLDLSNPSDIPAVEARLSDAKVGW